MPFYARCRGLQQVQSRGVLTIDSSLRGTIPMYPQRTILVGRHLQGGFHDSSEACRCWYDPVGSPGFAGTRRVLAWARIKKGCKRKSDFIKPAWNGTPIAFEMRAKPWGTVFEWFSDQTGMPFSSQYPPPTGSFTFINPKDLKTGKPRAYTLAEIFDVINELLQNQHKHTLIRLDSTLTMIPVDAELKGARGFSVTLSELNECARSEIVEIVLKLDGSYNAEEFAPEVKRMLGDFARVTPLPVTNQLIIRADVASLRRNLTIIIPANPENARTFTYKCVYVRASAAEAMIAKSLGTAKELVKVADNPMPGNGRPMPAAQTRERFVLPHTVASDDTTNTVFITGPPDKIDVAKTILAKLDLPRSKGDKRNPRGAAGLAES